MAVHRSSLVVSFKPSIIKLYHSTRGIIVVVVMVFFDVYAADVLCATSTL